MKKILIISLLHVLIVVASVPAVHAAEKLNVVSSILPVKYFVDQIGGDLVESSVMVLPGASPAAYEPKPRQMVALSKSRLFVAIGAPYEKAWLPRLKGRNLKIVHADAGIKKMAMKAKHDHGHGHGHDDHGALDPHIWNSPKRAEIICANILKALIKVAPQHKAVFERNYETTISTIQDVDKKIRKSLGTLKGKPAFMVYHPSWGYFADDYGLTQVAVEVEGKEPGPRTLAKLIKEARHDRIRAIFVQPQFARRSAQTIAKAVGAEVVVADPVPYEWPTTMETIAKALHKVLNP